MRILLDHNVPAPLARVLSAFDCTHASDLGWETLVNGALIAAAEAEGFGMLITGDKNLRFQQNLATRALAVIVISEIHWATIRTGVDLLITAIGEAKPNVVTFVELPRRQLRRRVPRPPIDTP
jgi:predicted nuclease of predicted toxin-antitoxin system